MCVDRLKDTNCLIEIDPNQPRNNFHILVVYYKHHRNGKRCEKRIDVKVEFADSRCQISINYMFAKILYEEMYTTDNLTFTLVQQMCACHRKTDKRAYMRIVYFLN